MTTELHYQSREAEKLVRRADALILENNQLKRSVQLSEQAQALFAQKTNFLRNLTQKLQTRISQLEQEKNGSSSPIPPKSRKQSVSTSIPQLPSISSPQVQTNINQASHLAHHDSEWELRSIGLEQQCIQANSSRTRALEIVNTLIKKLDESFELTPEIPRDNEEKENSNQATPRSEDEDAAEKQESLLDSNKRNPSINENKKRNISPEQSTILSGLREIANVLYIPQSLIH